MSTPNQTCCLLGNMNHTIDDNSRLSSQKNELAINIMTRTGSFMIVMMNIDSAGPNAVNAQPVNSNNVIAVRRKYTAATSLVVN